MGKKVFSKIARFYENPFNLPFYSQISETLCLFVKDFLNSSKKSEKTKRKVKVLEIGAGTGISTCILKKHFPDTEIVAVDNSLEMLKIFCQKELKDVYPVCADAEKFETKEKFDIILASFSLHWFFSENILKKILRLLSRDGIFAFSIPLNPASKSSANRLLTKVILKLRKQGFPLNSKSFSLSEILKIFENFSLKCVYKTQNIYESFTSEELIFMLKSRGAWDFMFGSFQKEAEILWDNLTNSNSCKTKKLQLEWKILYLLSFNST
jgi:ubiquinone/menaquinone biosynthesis C-methylase UbiE